MSATIRRVARPRGELNLVRRNRILAARDRASDAQVRYREEIVEALEDGASFAWLSEVTGLSTNTLQRWKREAR